MMKTITKGAILRLSGNVSNKFTVKSTIADDSGNNFSGYVGKFKILKSHHRKLGLEIDAKCFDD